MHSAHRHCPLTRDWLPHCPLHHTPGTLCRGKEGLCEHINGNNGTCCNEYENVKNGCLDVIDVQCVDLLRNGDQFLLEKIRSPGQEVVEVVALRIIPVDAGDQDSTRGLTKADQRRLVFRQKFNKTYNMEREAEKLQRGK